MADEPLAPDVERRLTEEWKSLQKSLDVLSARVERLDAVADWLRKSMAILGAWVPRRLPPMP